jgi:excisionase family DNA binding protein
MSGTAKAPLTISVVEAGRLLGIKSKDAAYAAAHAGEIPIIRLGRLLRVPVRALERMLDQAYQKGEQRSS